MLRRDFSTWLVNMLFRPILSTCSMQLTRMLQTTRQPNVYSRTKHPETARDTQKSRKSPYIPIADWHATSLRCRMKTPASIATMLTFSARILSSDEHNFAGEGWSAA